MASKLFYAHKPNRAVPVIAEMLCYAQKKEVDIAPLLRNKQLSVLQL